MNEAPLISVIVAVFNGASTLQQCIDSVAVQTWPHRELIVVDGGSNDGTVDLLRKNEEEIAWWISEPDQGIYDAWNKGVRQARGEWICFLGVDDYLWDKLVLEHMAKGLTTLSSNINIAYGQVMLLDRDGVPLYPIGGDWQEAKARFRQIMSIPHPGLMHRRNLFERYGGFDASFRIAGDYEFLQRELKDGDAAFIPGIVTVGMRYGGISSSPENSLASLRETRRAQKMHGLPFPGMLWLAAMARIYLRLLAWSLFGERVARHLLDLVRRINGLPSYWTRT